MPKRGRGRPVLGPGEAKTVSVRVRFRKGEFKRVRTAAQAKGMSVAAWIRERVLRRLRTPKGK